jgi:DNA gyrase subunit B
MVVISQPLILTFFFRFMRELLKKVTYIAAPPLYLVKRGIRRNMHGMMQRDQANERMGGSASIQRYKGLGDECRTIMETTMDPSFRTLRQITIDAWQRPGFLC